LLSINFNALCRVMYSFFFRQYYFYCYIVSYIDEIYVRGKVYLFSNLVFYNPFAFFPVMWDYFLCAIVTHRFTLLIICFCPSISHIEFSSSNSSYISQFEFLMKWHFLSSNCDIVVKFISVFTFFLILMATFHVVGKPDLTILVSNFGVVQVIENVCILARIFACF
jgi:hypothetical protein